MKLRKWFGFSIMVVSLFLSSNQVWACACCAENGEYGIPSNSVTLSLPLSAKMLRYRADVHDGKASGGGPLLYKEWRFEGPVKGTGFFRPGITPEARYLLVLQGRGNNCDNAEDFSWPGD